MAINNTFDYRPINSTFFRRFLTRVADRLRICELGSQSWRSKLPICRNFTIKHGKNNLAEAHTIQYIAHNTTLPVPKVYCAFSRKGKNYIVMQRMAGTMLASGWSSRSIESRETILHQLKDMITQLRQLSSERSSGVSNVSGGPVFDCRLPSHDLHGPFTSVQDFHTYLRNGYNGEHSDATEHNELVKLHLGEWPICFTHGDLSSLNIIAKGDKITGIVDWETAGWYPAYWEYVTAWNVNVYNIFWRKHIGDFLDPMPKELAMEKLRNALYGYDWFFVEDESYLKYDGGSAP